MRHLPVDAPPPAPTPGAAFTAFQVIPGAADAGLIVVCDHASNAIPTEYGTLGLPQAQLQRHIGYDIGAAWVTRALAERFGCPAVMSCFSRLLIDPNRGEEDPTLVMKLSDGAVVPGNARVDAAETMARIERFHRPYHAAVSRQIEASLASGVVPMLLAIHSFTPIWRGLPRPWHAAILWDTDPRLAKPLMAALRAPGDVVIGDNEPYDGALRGDSMWRHGTQRGLSHAIIEVRQDLIGSEAGARVWAARIADALAPSLADPANHCIEQHGSRTDARLAAFGVTRSA